MYPPTDNLHHISCKLSSKSTVFTAAKKIITVLQKAGFDGFIVGGWIRNKLLKIPTSDIDIATNATPTQLKKLFFNTVDTGIKFGTITVLLCGVAIEVTTFRIDGLYTASYRKPQNVIWSGLASDSCRRDFSINAVYFDPINQYLIDPQSGLRDLNKKVIKTVGDPTERLQEDRLRVIRAARFFAQLANFTIDSDTIGAMLSTCIRPWIPSERILKECRLCARYKKQMYKFLYLLLQTNKLDDILLYSAHTINDDTILNRLNAANTYLYRNTDISIWLAIIYFPYTDATAIANYLKLSKLEKANINVIFSLSSKMQNMTNPADYPPHFWLYIKRPPADINMFRNAFMAACICTGNVKWISWFKHFIQYHHTKMECIILKRYPTINTSDLISNGSHNKELGDQIDKLIIEWIDHKPL